MRGEEGPNEEGRHWPNETRALTMKEMKEGVTEERSVQRPKKHTG